LIATIHSLLDENDFEAVGEVEKLASMVKGTTMSQSVETVAAALAEFDFGAAAEGLRKLELV
jgi:hypothetical protein